MMTMRCSKRYKDLMKIMRKFFIVVSCVEMVYLLFLRVVNRIEDRYKWLG